MSTVPQTSAACPCARKNTETVPYTTPTRAYGLIIDQTSLRKWTMAFHEKILGEDLSKLPPQEAEEELQLTMFASFTTIPSLVYEQFPRIPRLHRRLILMNGARGTYLLVLQDNSSEAALNAVIDPSDVEGVRKMLDLGDQKPKWYGIPR
ncbi:hypothetical protein C8Q74DRAFT_1215142 [Fomes fomentarius]|nr:hypothetical protein C8Q74DRAFT_1215142 [Fomes fomentarius]